MTPPRTVVDADVKLAAANDLIRRLVADMKMWGSWGDGVPGDCRSFDDAVAALGAKS